jgi:hypothetical protein
MCCAIKEWTGADCLKAGMHNELKSYLDANLEETEDVVGWWGVSFPFLLWNVVLIWCRITWHSTCHRRGPAPTGLTGRTRWGERCTCAGPWTGSTLSTLLMMLRNSLTHRVPRTNGYVSQSLDGLTLYDSFVRCGLL